MNLEDLFVYILVLFIGLVITLILFECVKSPNSFLKSLKKILGIMLGITLIFYLLSFLVYVFYTTTVLLYRISLRVFQSLALTEECSTYLALTIALLSLSYLPETLGYWMFRFLEKFTKNKYILSDRYRIIIKSLRLRLWIYLISFILIALSSFETFNFKSVIAHPIWAQFKPVILQSVLTVITLDRFINLLKSENEGICRDLIAIYQLIKEFFNSMLNNSKGKSN